MDEEIELVRFPTEEEDFANDERISLDRITQSYKLEDEKGNEWEWLEKPRKWVPVTDEALVEQQQQAYKVAGVDENESVEDQRKRKASHTDEAASTNAKKQKAEPAEKKNNAIYVTSIPDDATFDEIQEHFERYGGVIAESADTNKARIKMYYDDNRKFKGDALIVYYRPESVKQAINLLDETEFRPGQPTATGPMRVQEADSSFKSQKDKPLSSDQAKTKGTGANRDRQKIIKKNEEMNSRLADWDDDDPSTLPDTSSRWDKVVVLKHMFTLKELAEDASALLEIKDDIREECEKLGTVTNVVLYDKEEDGIVTVRFSNATSAEACIRNFDGRWFDGRQVVADIADGRERFKKSSRDEDHSEQLVDED